MSDVSSVARVVTHPKAHPVMGVVVALCAYEMAADVVNDTLGATLLPSMRSTITRFSWRAVGRRAVPRWSPQGTVIALGIVGGLAVRSRAARQSSKR